MIKVLHLANVGGQTRGGGVHEVAYNFYKYQSGLGIDPYLWFPGNEAEKEEFNADPNIRVIPTYGNPNWGITKDLFASHQSVNFDLIHQHGIWLPNSLLSKRFRKKERKEIIIQPHGYLEPFRLEMSKLKKKVAYYTFEKENLDNCRLLLACSDQEAINLKEMFPKKEVAMIPNGIPLHFLQEKASSDYQTPFPDKKTMLFLSRIHPLKGLERFLKVIHSIGVKKFSDWGFAIAGFEEVGHEKQLKELVKDLDLEHFVKFVGPKFGQEKIDLISHADLFVLPTFNENYGIVVAEALARSVPVLTTKGTPWNELDSHQCGFWVDNDEAGIKAGLLQMLAQDSDSLKQMGENGKALVLSKYTWEKTTSRTKILYDWILGGGNRPEFVN